METNAFLKQLASNNRSVRQNALETLHKYLNTKQFKEAKQFQFNKLWKGLYFAMWFSDRPRPQQRLANQLGELTMLYFDERDNKKKGEGISSNDEAFIKFSKGFWKIICLEWFNIDRHRIDKFLLLVRRSLLYQLKYLQSRKWNEKLVETYIEKVMKWLPLSGKAKVYNGVPLHIMDIFFDEWERLLKPEEEEEEKEESTPTEMAGLVQATPLEQFLTIFKEINLNLNNSKVLRDKIKEELFKDARLIEWEIVIDETKLTEANEEEDEVVDDDDGDEVEEWHGF